MQSALLALLEEWWGLRSPKRLLAAALVERGVCADVAECCAVVERLVAAGYLTCASPPDAPPEAQEVAWTHQGWIRRTCCWAGGTARAPLYWLVLSAGPLVRLSTGHAHATGMAATKPPSTRTAIRVPCDTIPYTIFLVHEYHSIVVM